MIEARNSLEKTGNPGWDKDTVRNVAEHLETQAHVAGKTAFSWQLNDILASDGMFRGDPATLENLKEKLEQVQKDSVKLL